jgi:tetratricopeptide (TPR) repeat protein
MRTLACLLLLCATTVDADQNDPRLEDLFTRLKTATSVAEAVPIEELIWQIWTDHDDPVIALQMQRGIDQMSVGALPAALATYDRLVQQAPEFAEAWNKRATVHYLLGNYAESEADIVQTLRLEPYHFGALSGRGLVNLAQRKFEAARSAFNAALEVNPNMPATRNNVETINEYLNRSTI